MRSAPTDIEVFCTENHSWLSNAYLVLNRAAGQAILIDGNGVPGPLLDQLDGNRLELSAVLLTHHHADHILIDGYRRSGAVVMAHPATAGLAQIAVDRTLADGESLTVAGLSTQALYTPGHAHDHIAYVVEGVGVFTGDVLFKGTVGGTRGSGGTNRFDLRGSIQRILALPVDTVVYPGHRESTTVGAELAANPFVLAWNAGEEPLDEACTVRGEQATLLLWGPDYDGTHKAWVRFADGVEHTVGGSQVVRGA
ncbi:MAG: MBL fold metallo-hydrolase [Solirubrobacteraceae bacterium]